MVNIGILGCGSITKLRHAPEYAAHPGARLVGFFDPVTDRARELAEQYGAKVYESTDDMLASPEIDAVSVCTANRFHAPVTIQALKNHKHVLCEKPMAITLEECEAMIHTARETGKYLMIGHNQRLVPAHIKAREIIRRGDVGRILSFKTSFGHGGPEAWSADKSAGTWFFQKNHAFVGALGDLGIHKVDLIRWLLGEEIVEVQAMVSTLDKKGPDGNLIDVDDHAICLLKSAGGITGTLTASWVCYGEEDNSTILYCTEGIVKIFGDPTYPVTVIRKNGESEYYKVKGIQTNTSQTKSGVIDLFVDSILKGIPPEISGEEGLAAMKVITACVEASQKGCSIKID